MDKTKPFGLTIVKKGNTFRPKKGGIFDSDSDDEAQPKRKAPKIPQSKPILAVKTEEDPSIYEYDEVYDEIKAQKAAEIAPKVKKSSRYIDHLLKAADKRKKEYERRVERKVQVEREKEGDEFKDKEMFVTSSYKKKLQEMEEEEERERRENQINDMMDVTKQKDLSGFYRHFLKQSVGEEKIPVFGEEKFTTIKKEPQSDTENDPVTVTSNETVAKPDSFLEDKDDSDCNDSSSDEDSNSGESFTYEKSIREYRKRKESESPEKRSDDELSVAAKNTKSQSNSKKTTNKHRTDFENSKSFKRKTSGDEEDPARKSKLVKKTKDSSDVTQIGDEARGTNVGTVNLDSELSNDSDIKDGEQNPTSNGACDTTNDDAKTNKKIRNIYEKRTVGDVFSEAQARYFQRLATRSAA